MRKKLIWTSLFLCVLLTLSVCICVPIYFLYTIGNVFQDDSDISWVEDHMAWFIARNGRLPENWDELKDFAKNVGHDPYISSDTIESRIEMNFELMKAVNARADVVPRSWDRDAWNEVWIYRFRKNPKQLDQKRIMATFFYRLYAFHHAQRQCNLSVLCADSPENGKAECFCETSPRHP